MEKILFILDSPCDVLPEHTQEFDIRIAPVTVTIDGVTRRDFFDIERTAFWKELATLPELPKTAMISPEKFLEMFLQARNDGFTHVIVMPLSTTATGTFTSATTARGLLEEDHGGGLHIEVIDSRNYSFLYGRLACEGAAMAKAGASFDEVVRHVRSLVPRSQALLWVYSLAYLKRSGRITGMSAFVGETLGIRPILWIRDGLIAPVEKVRGDKNLIPRMIELSKGYIDSPQDQDMFLLHADVPEEEIVRCEQMVAEHIGPRSLKRHPIGAVISINTGPQAMALTFWGKPVIRNE